MSSVLLACFYINCMHIAFGQTILRIGTTNDDWNGWGNDNITTIYSTSTNNKKYHGIFDGDDGETTLSRTDIQLSVAGELIMNFTLIFACQITANTDKITVNIGTTSNEYYRVDNITDYPYTTTAGFTIRKYSNIDNILPSFCNDSVWSIKSSIKSSRYKANIPINSISFISSFNYENDQQDRYWLVTDIIFTLLATDRTIDSVETGNTATLVTIIIVCVILLILLIVLCRYLYKSKQIRDRKRKYSYTAVQLSKKELLTIEGKGTGQNSKSKKKKAKKAKLSANAKATMHENISLQTELQELQMVNNQLSVRQMSKDNQIKEAVFKLETMKQTITNLESSIHAIKKQNAAKVLELMRKDQEMSKHMKAQQMLLRKMKAEESKDDQKNDTNVIVARAGGKYVRNGLTLRKVDKQWMNLKGCSFHKNVQLFQLRYGEFGAVDMSYDMESVVGRMYKYGGRDKWRFVMRFEERLRSKYWMVCGDRNNERMYLYGHLGELIVVSTLRKTVDVIRKLNKIMRNGGKCIVVNGNVHILGGLGASWHLLWNSKVRHLKKLAMSKDIANGLRNNLHFEAVGLEKKGMLLVFGGRIGTVNKDDIWQYTFGDCSWRKLSVRLPFKMHSFSCVVTNDERFVLIVGGIRGSNKKMDDIFILDVDTMCLQRSEIKCPLRGKLQVLLMDYTQEYELLLSGLLRENIENVIGQDIFDMIMTWTVANDVHLFDSNTIDFGAMHWRMSIESIIGVS